MCRWPDRNRSAFTAAEPRHRLGASADQPPLVDAGRQIERMMRDDDAQLRWRDDPPAAATIRSTWRVVDAALAEREHQRARGVDADHDHLVVFDTPARDPRRCIADSASAARQSVRRSRRGECRDCRGRPASSRCSESRNARAAANCDRLARCVKSPEMTIRSGCASVTARRSGSTSDGIDASEMQIRQMDERPHDGHQRRCSAPGLHLTKSQRRFERSRTSPSMPVCDAAMAERRGDLLRRSIDSNRSYRSSLPASARNGIDNAPMRPVDGAT